MKVVAISTQVDAAVRYQEARNNGYITFIYDHADPCRELSSKKFLYVYTDEELVEKIRLLEADFTVADEVKRY